MTDNVASLGFEVNSKPLDDAKQKLSEVATEAGKTGKAVDDFNQTVGKTGTDAAKAGDSVGKITPALSALEAAAKRAGVSVEDMRARTAAFNAETGRLAASSKTAATAVGAIAKEASAVAPALSAVAAASAAVTKEHEAHSSAIAGLRGNIKAMSPLLSQFGGGLGDLLQYSKAARLGLEGFAIIAAGAALLSLEKLGDEIERTKNRFAGLTGSTEAGARAYDAVKAAAKATGIETSVLAGAVEKAIIGQEKFADRNVISANSAEMSGKKAEAAAAAFTTFSTMLQANVATAAQAKTAIDALADSFAKTKTLTVDAFTEIRNASPKTAEAIAHAFGYQTVQEFIRELDKAPISLEQFERRMAQVAPQVATTFNPEHPKNFEQALAGVTAASKDLLETLAQAGAFDVFKNVLVGTKKEVEALSTPLETLATTFKDVGDKSEKSWGDFYTNVEDKSKLIGRDIGIDVDGALLKVLVTLGRFPGEGLSAITAWASGAIGAFKSVAESAISAAQAAASAIASIAKAGASSVANMFNGGGVSASGGAGGTEGIQLGPPSPDNGPALSSSGGASGSWDSGSSSGGSSGSWGGVVPQGGDAGAAGFDIGLSDLPAFASGGQFTVAGSGGTDSQVVAFKSTPGEVVTVSTPEQMAGPSTGAIPGVTAAPSPPSALGVVSATPEPAALATVKEITDAIDQSTIDITKKNLEGTNRIVEALNKLIGGVAAGVAATTVNPATGLPLAATSSAAGGSSSILSGFNAASGGGGGFTVKGLNSDAADYAAFQKQLKDFEAANKAAAPGEPAGAYPGFVTGGQKGDASSNYGAKGGGGSGASSFQTRAPTGSFSPVNPDYGNSYDFGMSNFYGTNYDGSGDIYGSVSDYNGGSSDFYGTNYDGSGSISGSLSDIGTTDVPYGSGSVSGFDGGNSSGGYNSGGAGGDPYTSGGSAPSMDYSGGGGSPDPNNYGYFATGGSFTVGGDGGLDTTPVFFHATKGETVEIRPAGATPTSVFIPAQPAASSAPAAASDPAASQTTTQTMTKNIVINVSGATAQDFIRSRAQIARGF